MNKPTKSSVLELCAKRNNLLPEWNQETSDFVDELYSRLEWAETEVSVLHARLNKQWTAGSNLYSQKEVDNETTKAYNQGYKDGSNHFYGEDCPLKHEPKTQNPSKPLAPNCRGLSQKL